MERFKMILNMALVAREAVLTAPTAHPRQVRAMTRLPLITPGRSTSLDKPTGYTAAIRNQPPRFTSVAALISDPPFLVHLVRSRRQRREQTRSLTQAASSFPSVFAI